MEEQKKKQQQQTYIVLPQGAVIKDLHMLPSAPKLPTEVTYDGSKANVMMGGSNNGFHFPPSNVISPVMGPTRTPLPVIGGE